MVLLKMPFLSFKLQKDTEMYFYLERGEASSFPQTLALSFQCQTQHFISWFHFKLSE